MKKNTKPMLSDKTGFSGKNFGHVAQVVADNLNLPGRVWQTDVKILLTFPFSLKLLSEWFISVIFV